jgi:hypothetical protein
MAAGLGDGFNCNVCGKTSYFVGGIATGTLEGQFFNDIPTACQNWMMTNAPDAYRELANTYPTGHPDEGAMIGGVPDNDPRMTGELDEPVVAEPAPTEPAPVEPETPAEPEPTPAPAEPVAAEATPDPAPSEEAQSKVPPTPEEIAAAEALLDQAGVQHG